MDRQYHRVVWSKSVRSEPLSTGLKQLAADCKSGIGRPVSIECMASYDDYDDDDDDDDDDVDDDDECILFQNLKI